MYQYRICLTHPTLTSTALGKLVLLEGGATARAAMATPRSLVAESAFSFLHMELVQIALGPDAAMTPTPSQLQLASRKIEAIGFQVGQRLIERYTKDRPRFTETLEIIKFICKDFWVDVYRKQIDKLQTNNRVSVIHFACAYATLYMLTTKLALFGQGVYMLQDNSHPVLTRCSPTASRQASAKHMAALHIKFPSGLIRGALSGLGVIASVSAEVSEIPRCQFTIKIQTTEQH